MSESASMSGIRFVVSWAETILGLGLTGIGAAYFTSVFRDSFGDPHGMGATIGLASLALGLSLIVSGLFLRARGRWPWFGQTLPILVVMLVTSFLI